MLAAGTVFIGTWIVVAVVQARFECTWVEMDTNGNGWISLPEVLRASDEGCETNAAVEPHEP